MRLRWRASRRALLLHLLLEHLDRRDRVLELLLDVLDQHRLGLLELGDDLALGVEAVLGAARQPAHDHVELDVVGLGRDDPLDVPARVPAAAQLTHLTQERLGGEQPDVAVDVLAAHAALDLLTRLPPRVGGGVEGGGVAAPGLEELVVEGRGEVVVDGPDRRALVAVLVGLQHLPDGGERPVHVEGVALVGHDQRQHAVVDGDLGEVGQPPDHVGDVLDDVRRHDPVVRRAGARWPRRSTACDRRAGSASSRSRGCCRR